MSNRVQRRAAISESRNRKSWEWTPLPIDSATGLLSKILWATRNDFYIVQAYPSVHALGDGLHLAISTLDRSGEPPWRDMQRIKDELVGEDCEAVQVYPRQEDVVDQAFMYHLFVMPRSWRLPFGLHREGSWGNR